MPSQSGSDSGRRLLVATGTAHFPKLADCDLLQVPHELERIATAFSALGYERLQGITDPDRDTLRKLFSDVSKHCVDGDLVVAYYTGHGARDQERFYLLTHDSDLSDLDETALPAEDFSRALTKGSKAAQVLVILDTCYAGAGASEIAQVSSRLKVALGGVGGPVIFILAAARPKQEANQGALSHALIEALTKEKLGGHLQPYLYLDEIVGEIRRYLKLEHPSQDATWDIVNYNEPCRLFPNPRHRPEIRPGLDLATQRAFTEHWVPKARGAELGAGGWYFTGREQALRELAAWLGEANSGGKARVVTGGPGCGKSALLARVVTLSSPQYRKEVFGAAESAPLDPATLPPEGVVSVAVHARHKLLAEVVAQIAEGLNFIAPDSDKLVKDLNSRPDKTVIVIDALDEADDKAQIVTRLLSPLARLPHVFLLIGTRPDSTEHGRKYRALGESAVEVDLDAPEYIGADDVARYVERRLLATEEPGRATPYRESPELSHTVAQAVSERAKSVFLVAHTAVLALLAKPRIVDVSEPGWIYRLPTGLDDAFSQFLGELDTHKPGGLSSQMCRAVLLPLAFAEGEGLPWVDLWSAVANAISGSPVSDADITLVREHAAPFIVEAVEQDRSVYRLYHEKVAEHLRASVNLGQVQQRIVEALCSRVPVIPLAQEPDWPRAHPYTLTYLWNHALKAGMIGNLAADGTFIAASEPLRTLQALRQSTDPFAQRAYSCYALAYKSLRGRPAEERLSYLELAARQLGDDALAEIWIRRRHFRRWTAPWVRGSSMLLHNVFSDRGGLFSVVLGTLEDRPVIVSCGEYGTVRMSDLATGAPIGEPLHGHEGLVNSVALGTLEDRSVIVSGGWDGTVRVWDLATGGPIGEPLRGHDGLVNSVVLGTLGDRPAIVSGGWDGTVRVWDLATGALIHKPLRGHGGAVNSVVLGTLEDRPVIVSGGWDGTVRVWDLATGAPIRVLSGCHRGVVSTVALGTFEDRPVIVSGGLRDGAVRLWDLATGVPIRALSRAHGGAVNSVVLGTLEDRPVIVSGEGSGAVRVCDLATGAPIRVLSRGHGSAVRSVALGTLEDRPVIVSGGWDGTVRVWDLATGAPIGEPSCGHVRDVRSVALGTLEDRSVIVSGGWDGTVRMWEPTTGASICKPLRGHEGLVNSVALCTLEDRLVIVSGGWDGTVQVWNLATGALIHKPLLGHGVDVSSFALGTLEDRPVIVSGGWDGTVRVWDLATGAPIGEPSCGHVRDVRSVALGTLEDRSVIVSGGWDGTVRVWDLATGAPIGEPLHGHEGLVNSVALGTLEDRSVIVSGGWDGTVRVWDLATGGPIGEPLRGHDGLVSSVVLGTLEDRPVIVSGGWDGTVRVWGYLGVEYATVNIGTKAWGLASTGTGIVVVAGGSGLIGLQFDPR